MHRLWNPLKAELTQYLCPLLILVALVSAILDSLFRHTTCSEVGGVTVASYVN